MLYWRNAARIALLGAVFCPGLFGCATSALDQAPERPDRPWTPETLDDGEIAPGAARSSRASTGEGYVLPANQKLAEVPGMVLTNRAQAYTLAELIDIAESSNPKTRVAWNGARRAALAAGIAKAAYLPRLTAAALTGYRSSENETPGLFGDAQAESSGRSSVVSASLQWLLFDFGERAALVDAANQLSIISNIAFTAAHQKVIHDVSLAYYANAAAQARVKTAATSLDNARKILAAAEQRYQQGVATVIEVSQARQATAQARLAAVNSRATAQRTYLDLMTAVGVSPLTHIPIAPIATRRLPAATSGSLNRIVRNALARRPDVLSAYARQKAEQARVRAARAEFLPKVFLSATGAHFDNSVGVTATPSFGQDLPTVDLQSSGSAGAIFAGVTVPLYDGGVRAAHLSQARIDAQNAALELDQTRKAAVRQIVRADNTLRSSLESNAAAAALVDASQTTFDGALAAYRNGVGTITAVTAAETQLLNAMNAATDAHSAALSAAATLALASGSLGDMPRRGTGSKFQPAHASSLAVPDWHPPKHLSTPQGYQAVAVPDPNTQTTTLRMAPAVGLVIDHNGRSRPR